MGGRPTYKGGEGSLNGGVINQWGVAIVVKRVQHQQRQQQQQQHAPKNGSSKLSIASDQPQISRNILSVKLAAGTPAPRPPRSVATAADDGAAPPPAAAPPALPAAAAAASRLALGGRNASALSMRPAPHFALRSTQVCGRKLLWTNDSSCWTSHRRAACSATVVADPAAGSVLVPPLVLLPGGSGMRAARATRAPAASANDEIGMKTEGVR